MAFFNTLGFRFPFFTTISVFPSLTTFSVVLLLVASTVLLDACYFSVLLIVSILFLAEIVGVMVSFTTWFWFPFFVYHVSIPFSDICVSSKDQCIFGIIQIPTCFSNLFNWVIIFFRQWVTDIG